jgi:hypothetical protein
MPELGNVGSSLPLQIAVYFNAYYSAAYVLVMLLLFIYKGALGPVQRGFWWGGNRLTVCASSLQASCCRTRQTP